MAKRPEEHLFRGEQQKRRLNPVDGDAAIGQRTGTVIVTDRD